uniref:Cilia- and flagella-associated protein 44 n=1 Tax=Strigamia maritima TaxID=126957 RepID=T1J7Z3_STRMM
MDHFPEEDHSSDEYAPKRDAEDEYDEDSGYSKKTITQPPRRSETAPRPFRNYLKLYESFGYDCYKRANIQMVDKNTLIFASGNFVNLFNINTKTKRFFRSIGGDGIGHITIHPSAKYFAVAEKGFTPNIYIYDCVTLNVKKILRGGADCGYSFITFNPLGTLLASIATEPDYTLTVWNWTEELIILRSQAFYNDVYVVAFSQYTPGFLTTGGTGHVKFWKMAKTFTGLKLQGILGRFGRTEVSTIEGVIQFPDGKVLSGSEWGNMLVWDADLIKVELIRRMGKFCHTAPVIQFLVEEGEILSVGCDGFIKVWQFEILDAADSKDGKGFFEVEPLNELKVGADVHLMRVVKSLDEQTPHVWFAQDRNGGIWKLDFSFSHISKSPEKLLNCHSGAVTGMDVSPISHLIATTGIDGTVRLYDTLSKKQLCEKRFFAGGSCLSWIPKEINDRGDLFSVGFSDGILRILAIQTAVNNLNEPVIKFLLIDCMKPHTWEITSIAFFSFDSNFVITGSKDKTVFIFTWATYLTPIGFVTMPGIVSSVSCSPIKFVGLITMLKISINKKNMALLAKKKTYSLDEECKVFTINAFDVKESFKRAEKLKEKLKATESESGEPTSSAESDEEEEEEFIKKTIALGPIIFGFCSQIEYKFWISMGGLENGYLYKYEILTADSDQSLPYTLSPDPVGALMFEHIESHPIHSFEFSPDGHWYAIGTQNGMIYIFKVKHAWNIESREYYWGDRMHDPDYGVVNCLHFTFDQKFLVSAGTDGNIFCFTFDSAAPPTEGLQAAIPENREEDELIEVNDINDPDFLSLEEERIKLEYNKLMKLVEKKKTMVLTQIRHFQNEFIRTLHSNTTLPVEMQMKRQDMIANKALRKELISEFEELEKQTRAELAWEAERHAKSLNKLQDRFKASIKWDVLKIKAFNSAATVSSYRLAYLSEDVRQTLIDKEEKKPNRQSVRESQTETQTDITTKVQDITTEKQVLKHVSEIFSLNIHAQRVIKRIEDRKRKKSIRTAEWEELKARKPDENKGDPVVTNALAEAKTNLGDYNLKSSVDFVVPDYLRMTTKQKLKELVSSLCMAFDYKEEFNGKVFALRNEKKKIISRIDWIVDRIHTIQKTMQIPERKSVPSVPHMENCEIPEEILKSDLAKLVPATDSGSTVGSGSDKPASKMPGMSRFRVSVVSALMPTSRARASVMLGRSPVTTRPSNMDTDIPETPDSDVHTNIASKTQASPLEVRLQKMMLKRNLHEQNILIAEVEMLKKQFDEHLMSILQEKYRLDVALKMGSARQIVLYGEMQLLAQFETEEEEMLVGINQTSDEKGEFQIKIQDLLVKIENRKREVERLREQEKLLQQELHALLGEHNKFGGYLIKVYKKKIKRSKKKGTGDGEEEEESSESEEDFEVDEEEEDEDEFIDDRECPDGCDVQLFNSVLTFRERRLDIEELLSEIRKFNEALRKEMENYNKKLKNVQALLLSLQTDFKKVQREKQSRLNELYTLAPIKLNQIQYVVNGTLPADLNPCLVFPANKLKQLEDRIRELQQERIIQRKNQKKSKLHHSKLVKECKLMDEKIALLQTKCHELMLEKFGCVVDLDNIESYAVSKAVEEMKEKTKTTEFEEEITKDVFKNTQRILGINEAMTELQVMEAQFMIRQKSLPLNLMPELTPRQDEERRLVKLVKCQEEEIDFMQSKLKRAGSKSFCPSRELFMPESYGCRAVKKKLYDEELSRIDERINMKEFIEELFTIDAKEKEAVQLSLDDDEASIVQVLPLEITSARSGRSLTTSQDRDVMTESELGSSIITDDFNADDDDFGSEDD